MRRSVLFTLIGAFLLAGVPAFCQDGAPGDATTPPAKKPFQWSAEFDGYSSGNTDGSGTNQLRAFDVHSNTFRVSMADLGLDYSADHFGAHLDGGYGDAIQIMAATDRLKGPNEYLPQFFVSYKPVKDSGLQIDFGKFYTSVGAEVPDSSVDYNYSRSLLFTLGEPLYHFGFRVSVPVTKTFTAGVQVVNGWNDVEDNNGGKTLGLTTALTEKSWGWSQAFLVGPEKDGTTAGQRQLVNEVFSINPRPSIQSYVEGLYGHDKRVGPGADSWYGAAAATRFAVTKRLSFTPRAEYYVDQTGFTSGTAQHLKELTATAEYRLQSLITSRLEFREDLSNQRFFGPAPNGLHKEQGTVMLALLFSLKGEK